MVSAEIYGEPKPGVEAGPGGVLLNRPPVKEIGLTGEARFGPFVFDVKALRQTNGGEPEALINVYSGRKSSPNNLIECDFYQGPLEVIQEKPLTLKCKLITEVQH